MSSPHRIAIVGGGFSGTMTAAQLLKIGGSPLTIYLVERDPAQLGRGIAYSRAAACHLLNVPAANMSAFPDAPDHFLSWAKTHQSRLIDPPWVTEISATSFLPRRAYGAYLQEVLDDAERSARPGVRLERMVTEAVGIAVESNALVLRLRGGDMLHADQAVLALGNFRPGNPAVADPSFYASPRYYADAWAFDLLPTMLQTQSCLLIGSGLTMVDWALTLSHAGYRGQMHAVSRRGLWPHGHAKVSGVAFSLDTVSTPRTVRAWLGRIRHYIRASGCDWRATIDALRPSTQGLWQSLSEAERRRFLRPSAAVLGLSSSSHCTGHRQPLGRAGRVGAIASPCRAHPEPSPTRRRRRSGDPATWPRGYFGLASRVCAELFRFGQRLSQS